MQIELSTGATLTAQPVSQVAVDAIIAGLGGYAEQARLAAMPLPELTAYLRAMDYEERARREQAQHKQMVYLFGWGIVETPDAEAVAVLDALGYNSPIPQIQRANWLIYAAGLTRADKSAIIGAVMAMTRAAEQ